MLLLWSLGPGRRRETMSACCTPVGKLRRRRRRRSKLLHSKAKRSHLIKLASIPMIMMKNNSRRYTDSISSMPCGQSRESRLVEKFSLKKMITCGTYAALSKILQISKEPWAPLTLSTLWNHPISVVAQNSKHRIPVTRDPNSPGY